MVIDNAKTQAHISRVSVAKLSTFSSVDSSTKLCQRFRTIVEQALDNRN